MGSPSSSAAVARVPGFQRVGAYGTTHRGCAAQTTRGSSDRPAAGPRPEPSTTVSRPAICPPLHDLAHKPVVLVVLYGASVSSPRASRWDRRHLQRQRSRDLRSTPRRAVASSLSSSSSSSSCHYSAALHATGGARPARGVPRRLGHVEIVVIIVVLLGFDRKPRRPRPRPRRPLPRRPPAGRARHTDIVARRVLNRPATSS